MDPESIGLKSGSAPAPSNVRVDSWFDFSNLLGIDTQFYLGATEQVVMCALAGRRDVISILAVFSG
ncbi:hypothetical protein [Dechloromonas sp.]|uniref:hypothetical protein n=1 Tax=Dechloromonas sp. TaxID=1917218 RepID=UPI00286E686D|nr:hypothetical protein [Dechloromonas sp.]